MARITTKGQKIRDYILTHVTKHPMDVVAVTAKQFGLTRQAINRHIKSLIEEGTLTAEGKTNRRKYSLCIVVEKEFFHPLDGLQEDLIWRKEIEPLLSNLPESVQDIWHYGFTEMVNNVIDHSDGEYLKVNYIETAINIAIYIRDNGVGIFRKIKNELSLDDMRDAVLELSKGKLTTDPENHTGEGIFFSSRMFDDYGILSSGIFFEHEYDEDEDWIAESEHDGTGTLVYMNLEKNSPRDMKAIFNKFSVKDGEYGFNKTVVPVKLVKHGAEKLVSRSQAKRLLARFDKFKTVILDFKDIDTIGQSFADEVFRVFCNAHPEVKIIPVNINNDIKNMIKRAKGVRKNTLGGYIGAENDKKEGS